MSDPKPTKWLSDDGRAFDSETEARQRSWNGASPAYDQSAIDRLAAERDDCARAAEFLELELAKFQIATDAAKAERDAAVADAERYRLLRDKAQLSVRDVFGCWWMSDHGHPATLDEALDIYGASIVQKTEGGA